MFFLLYFYLSLVVKCFSLFKKYFSSFKRNASSGGNNNQGNNPRNSVFGEPSKKKKENKKKKEKKYDRDLWKKHMDSKKKAKALDRRYKALVEKICTKHGIPTELQLEILSYIDGMVYDAWDNRQMETLLAFSVSYKAGNAVLIRDKLSLSKKEFLA